MRRGPRQDNAVTVTIAIAYKDICGIFAWNVLVHSTKGTACRQPLYGCLAVFSGMLGMISFHLLHRPMGSDALF